MWLIFPGFASQVFCVLCLQQLGHRDTTLTLAQKIGCGLWGFLQQLLVCEKQTSTSCPSIHILVFISILICFCCCSWWLTCPCTILAPQHPVPSLLLEWQSKSPFEALGPVPGAGMEWCGSTVIPSVWDTKTSDIPTWHLPCSVVSVTSSLELSCSVYAKRPTLVLCSLTLLSLCLCFFHLFPVRCLWWFLQSAWNQNSDVGERKGWAPAPELLRWCLVWEPCRLHLPSPKDASLPLQRSDLLEDGRGWGSEISISLVLP